MKTIALLILLSIFTVSTAPEPIIEYEPPLRYTYEESVMLAKTVWGEAGACTEDEQRLVIWTILQRVDSPYWSDTIEGVITQKGAFYGYKEYHPVKENIYELCVSELTAWQNGAEPPVHEVYAPTVPYFYFDGDGKNNYFREVWR